MIYYIYNGPQLSFFPSKTADNNESVFFPFAAAVHIISLQSSSIFSLRAYDTVTSKTDDKKMQRGRSL